MRRCNIPKYQIILSSDEQIPDDEFQKLVHTQGFFLCGKQFKLVYARNLEGIRKELWEKKKELIDKAITDVTHEDEQQVQTDIDETFNQINQLFKIGN